jgi:hypothetical protein
MTYQCYALWRDKSGQRRWKGPFEGNAAAQDYLGSVADKSGGSLVLSDRMPRTPAEVREALPLLKQEQP